MPIPRLSSPALFCPLFVGTLSSLQAQIPNGRYIGYENNPIHFLPPALGLAPSKEEKLVRNERYIEVTITISDSAITITKIPVTFMNTRLTKKRIDSTAGGYYHYRAEMAKNPFGTFISGFLTTCKYCERFGDAIPLYNYADYSVIQEGKNLLLSTEREKNILFKKQKRGFFR